MANLQSLIILAGLPHLLFVCVVSSDSDLSTAVVWAPCVLGVILALIGSSLAVLVAVHYIPDIWLLPVLLEAAIYSEVFIPNLQLNNH